MQQDRILVIFQDEGKHITARTLRTGQNDHPYNHLTQPLRQRGLVCNIEFGLSDYIVHAEQPDGSAFIISPPQEPPGDHRPGYPDSWLVTWHNRDLTHHVVVHDSAPDGPHARSAGSVTDVLAAVDARLDQLRVPHPSENPVGTLLQRAGFIPVAASSRDRFHRLPAAMTDPDEQRQAVTRAVDMLQTDGFGYVCEADLLRPSLPVRPGHPAHLDRASAARATSPIARHTAPALPLAAPAVRPSQPSVHRSSARGR